MDSEQIVRRLPTPTCEPLYELLKTYLPSIPVSSRKALMTVVRVGVVPRHNPRLRQHLAGFINETFPIFNRGMHIENISGRVLLSRLEPLFSSPVRRSLVSMYLRAVPYADESMWTGELESAKAKELSVTQNGQRFPTLEYPFLRSFADCLRHQLHPDIPFHPAISILIRQRLIHWRDRLCSMILIPMPSSKSMGVHSSRAFEKIVFPHYKWHQHQGWAYATVHLEQYYMENGETSSGPCEVRFAWKYNDLKPRIYYALGADAYFASRYVWAIFDLLQRILRTCDPKTRYDTFRFPEFVSVSGRVTIYDYSAFTSNMVDFKSFVAGLADFCEGYKTRIFDTYHGVVEISLAKLLRDYNDTCNIEPKFAISRIENLDPDDDCVIMNHLVAGMLGVYGNIVGCTSLHGIVLSSTIGSEDACNSIGDDAVYIHDEKYIDDQSIATAIRTIGDIAEDKRMSWTKNQGDVEHSQAWHYTKRPINLDSGIVDIGWMPDFPILPLILDLIDSSHTVPSQPFHERRGLCIKQTCRLFESMTRHLSSIDSDDIDITLSLMEKVYEVLKLPNEGAFPRKRYHEKSPRYPHETLAVPCLSEESIREGWWIVLKRNAYEGGTMNLPIWYGEDELPDELLAGHEFVYGSEKILSLYEKLGVVSKSAVSDEVLIDDRTMEIYEDFIFKRRRPLYKYTVHSDAPAYKQYMEQLTWV